MTAALARQRGATLIIVLIVLSGLSLLAFGISYRSRVESRLSQYQYERALVRQLAEAGLVLAQDRLLRDDPALDYLAEPWHAELALDPATLLPESLMQRYKPELTVCCADEQGKINLTRPEALGLVAGVSEEAAQIVPALADWTDEDAEAQPGGAESAYYESLASPYLAKNLPIQRMDELLLIKGVDARLFYGEDHNGNRLLDDVENDRDRSFPPDNGDSRLQLGLLDTLTVYVDGKININTAPREVLLALPGLSPESVELLLQLRDGKDGQAGTDDDEPFEAMADVKARCNLSAFEADVLEKFATFSSRYFRIVARASLDDGRVACQLEMVVQRVEGKVIPILCQEVTWKQ